MPTLLGSQNWSHTRNSLMLPYVKISRKRRTFLLYDGIGEPSGDRNHMESLHQVSDETQRMRTSASRSTISLVLTIELA